MFTLYLIRMFSSLIIWRCVKGFVICPYCDPEHDPYPNIKEAMRGYDVPMGDPNPAKGNYDPGVRSQIFMPTVRNKDAYYKLDMSFITANSQIKVRIFIHFKDLNFIRGLQRSINEMCLFQFSVMRLGLQTFTIHIKSTLTVKPERLPLDME